MQDCHHNVLEYDFPSAGLNLSSVFAAMEQACRDLPVDDYSVSQNTLDNVCIALALAFLWQHHSMSFPRNVGLEAGVD